MSALSKDIIQRLLMKDPKKRLGCGPTDADEIKQHPFFQVKQTTKLTRSHLFCIGACEI